MIKKETVLHRNYSLTEYTVEITPAMRADAMEFAKDIIGSDNQFSRLEASEEEEIQRTYVGKLGELAFAQLLNDLGKEHNDAGMLEVYEGQENTDSFDFETADGRTVDIKTAYLPNHIRLMINEDQFQNTPKDYYVGVKLHARKTGPKTIDPDSVEAATIHGYAEYTYLKTVSPRDYGLAQARAIPLDHLMAIDRLLDRF